MRLIDADAHKQLECMGNGQYEDVKVVYEWEIDNAPTIEALSAERTGEWIVEGDCGITRCGQCGWSIEECIEWNYCPNCGAKMKGAR